MSHFGLTALPFTREVPVDALWRPEHFKEHLDDLHEAVLNRMSCVVISPPGEGKTALLRALIDLLPEARFRVSKVKVTRLSARDFCREISSAMGCEPAGYYGALVHKIQERSLTLMDQEALRPIIVLDEAHDMRPDVLAILRVLTNFAMDSRLVVSVILAGQMPLKTMLMRDDLEAVSRRLAHVVTLRLLSRGETRQYIEHRLAIAGGTNGVFDDKALEAICEIGQGNMRATDRIALKAMQLACRKGEAVVGQHHVAMARKQVLL